MNISREDLISFLRESNKIEGILREPTRDEIDAAEAFLELDEIIVADLAYLVHVFQPGAKLRDKSGMDVRVGNHKPRPGGELVAVDLEMFLEEFYKYHPYQSHRWFESIHPFMDGNGRSGRMLWLWMMLREKKYVPEWLFLRHWYYQTLQEGR